MISSLFNSSNSYHDRVVLSPLFLLSLFPVHSLPLHLLLNGPFLPFRDVALNDRILLLVVVVIVQSARELKLLPRRWPGIGRRWSSIRA